MLAKLMQRNTKILAIPLTVIPQYPSMFVHGSNSSYSSNNPGVGLNRRLSRSLNGNNIRKVVKTNLSKQETFKNHNNQYLTTKKMNIYQKDNNTAIIDSNKIIGNKHQNMKNRIYRIRKHVQKYNQRKNNFKVLPINACYTIQLDKKDHRIEPIAIMANTVIYQTKKISSKLQKPTSKIDHRKQNTSHRLTLTSRLNRQDIKINHSQYRPWSPHRQITYIDFNDN